MPLMPRSRATLAGCPGLEGGQCLEAGELLFQLPLGFGPLIGREEAGAARGEAGRRQVVSPARRVRTAVLGRFPKALTRQKAVLQAVARQLLEIALALVVAPQGQQVFVAQIDAGNAFIVGGERQRHAGPLVVEEGMILVGNI
jgi:hypothetical protein